MWLWCRLSCLARNLKPSKGFWIWALKLWLGFGLARLCHGRRDIGHRSDIGLFHASSCTFHTWAAWSATSSTEAMYLLWIVGKGQVRSLFRPCLSQWFSVPTAAWGWDWIRLKSQISCSLSGPWCCASWRMSVVCRWVWNLVWRGLLLTGRKAAHSRGTGMALTQLTGVTRSSTLSERGSFQRSEQKGRWTPWKE